MTIEYVLKLYITGQMANSLNAIRNLESILEAELKDSYALEVIDMLENPKPGMKDEYLATPTLIKVSPAPVQRIIGDLSDKHKVLLGLNLDTERQEPVPRKLQNIHEEACINTSDALAKLIGRQTIVDIVNQNIRRVDGLTPPIISAKAVAAVRLPVISNVEGAALLLFSKEAALHLSDLLIKKEPGATNKLDELDISALEELGNIVCGTYFTTLSNCTGFKMVERIAQFTFDKLPAVLEQTITGFTENREDVLAIETEFNFTVPTLKGLCFKTHFLALFENNQLEAILNSLQKVAV